MNRKLFILLLLIYQIGFAQEVFKKIQIQTTLGSIISSDSTTPFLLRSNQYGIVPLKSGLGYLNISIKKEYDSLYTTTDRKLKKFGYGYGIETHLNVGRVNKVLLPVAHIKIRYGAFELYGGRRREIQGLVDTLGTMGSYIWSGNALPMPKIEISIPTYTPIIKNGLIAIKGNFAHGWFGKGDSVQNVWLHQKSFYARIGRPAWKIHLIGGFNHQVQWGGYPTKPFYDAISKQTITKFGTDFATFIKMATGVRLNKNGVGWANQPGVSANEAGNRVGNHIGTADIGFVTKAYNSTISVYKQSIFEDGSLFYLSNIEDGLYGVSLNHNAGILRHLTIEYLYTMSQGGDAFEFQPQLRGRDNYFNNSLYMDNWTYRSQNIGTSLITLNNNNGKLRYFDNRVKATHISLYYSIRDLSFKTQILQSQNYGTYFASKYSKLLSLGQSIEMNWRQYIASFCLSIDSKENIAENLGTNIKICRKW